MSDCLKLLTSINKFANIIRERSRERSRIPKLFNLEETLAEINKIAVYDVAEKAGSPGRQFRAWSTTVRMSLVKRKNGSKR